MSAGDGLGQMQDMRARRVRQPPPPRNPKFTPPAPPQDQPATQAEPPQSIPLEETPVPTVIFPPVAVAPARPAADTSTTGGITIYLSTQALAAVRASRSPGVTNAHIALQAIEATHDKLRELIVERRGGQHAEPAPTSGLFPPRSGSAARASAVRRVMWSVRLTPAEVDVVDQLAAATGAASRSELVSVAVEAYMSTHSTQR